MKLRCGARQGDCGRVLAEVDPETGRVKQTIHFDLGKPDAAGNLARPSRPHIMAWRTDERDGWHVRCHEAKCGAEYVIRDEELATAVRSARGDEVWAGVEVGVPKPNS